MGGCFSSDNKKLKKSLKMKVYEIKNDQKLPTEAKEFNYPQNPQNSQNALSQEVQSLENIQEMVLNIEKQLAVQNKVQNKDIIFTVGATGAGKSSMLNVLSGVKTTINQETGLLEFDWKSNQKKFATGDDMQSTTVQVNYFTHQNLEILDPPGLFDTKGWTQDIINSCIIIKTIKNAKSIRFAIMISPSIYCTEGRGSLLRQLADSFVQLFKNFEKFKDSILLIFNRIPNDQQQSKKIEEAKDLIGKIANSESDQKKQFCEMLVDKIKEISDDNQSYAIFHPEQDRNRSQSILRKMTNLQKINKEVINKEIDFVLNNSSLSQFEKALKDCLSLFKKSLESGETEESKKIYSSLSYLNQNITLVKSYYNQMIGIIEEQNKEIESLKQKTTIFIKSKELSHSDGIQIITKINQLINLHYFAEQVNSDKKKPEIKIQNDLVKVLSFLETDFNEKIYQKSKSENLLSFKFNQIQKFKMIYEHDSIIKTFTKIKDHYKQKLPIPSLFSNQQQKLTEDDFKQNLQFLSSKVQQIITNLDPEKSQDIQTILENIQFVKNNSVEINKLQGEDLQILDLQEFVFKQIYEFRSEIDSIVKEEKIYQSIIEISISENKEKSENQKQRYQFIRFMCSEQNTGQFFQDEATTKEYQQLSKSIIEAIKQLQQKGKNADKLEEAFVYQKNILSLKDLLDDESKQQIDDNKTNTAQYQIHINKLFSDQVSSIQSNLLETISKINLQYESESDKVVQKSLLDDLDKKINELQHLIPISEKFLEINSVTECVRNTSKIYETELSKCLTNIREKELHQNQLNIILIFKKIQVAVIIIKAGKSQQSEEISQFIRDLIDIIKNLKHHYLNDLVQKHNTIIDYEKIYPKIESINLYKQFLNFVKEFLTEDILKIQSNNIGHTKNSQSMNKLNSIQFDEEIENQIKQIENELNSFQKKIIENIKTKYKPFDFDNIENIMKLETVLMKEVLDQLKNLQRVDTLFVDKYQEVKRCIRKQFQSQSEQIACNFELNEEYKDLDFKTNQINQFQEKLKQLSDHEIEINLNFETELKRLQFQKLGLDSRISKLLLENNYKEVSTLIKSLNDQNKTKTNEQIKKNLQYFIEEIGKSKQNFIDLNRKGLKNNIDQHKQSLTQFQEEIFKNIKLIDSLYSNFNSLIGIDSITNIQRHFQQYINELISSLFSNLKSNQIEYDHIKSVIQLYLNNIQSLKNQNQKSEFIKKIINQQDVEFKSSFIKQITNQYKEVLRRIKELNEIYEEQNTQHSFQQLFKITSTTKELSLHEYNTDESIKTCRNEIYKELKTCIQKQTERYLYSLYNFNDNEIGKYIDSHFQEILNFFEVKENEIELWKKDIIQTINKNVEEYQQIFESTDYNKMHIILEKEKFGNYFLQGLRNVVALIDIEINIKCIPYNNFKPINQHLKTLQNFATKYKDQPKCESVYKAASDLIENTKQQVKQIQEQVKNMNLNKIGNIKSIISNLVKISEINSHQISPYEDLKLVKVIEIISEQLKLKYQQTRNNIKNLDQNSSVSDYMDIKAIAEESILYQNQHLTLIQAFKFLIQLSANQCLQNQEYQKQMQQFSNLNQFNDLIQEKQNALLSEFKQLWEKSQYGQILELQLRFKNFCIELDSKTKFKYRSIPFIFSEIESIYQKMTQEAEQIPNQNQTYLSQLEQTQQKLVTIENTFGDYITTIKQLKSSQVIQNKIKAQLKQLLNDCEKYISQFENERYIEKFQQTLVKIQKYSHEKKEQEMKNQIKGLMAKAIVDQKFTIIQNIQKYFNKDPYGAQIMEENKELFFEWNNQMYKNKTDGQNNLEYIIQNLRTTQLQDDKFETNELQAQFNDYQLEFDKLNKDVLMNKLNHSTLTLQIQQQAQDFKSSSPYLREIKQIEWSQEQKSKLIKLLAHLSSLWTLLDRNQYEQNGRQQSGGKEKQNESTRIIHKIQIISIMRLLCIDQTQKSLLHNHIVQIRTGEGKSIAIGITATILALLGFQVDCCCYSHYLSERDFQAFEYFFINFNVQSRIKFNIFDKLAENMINNNYNLRDLGNNHLNQTNLKFQSNNISTGSEKKIIIIDEVDFFYGENFLGQVYPVGCEYTNPEVVNLFKYIWKKKYSKITIKRIKESKEYQELFSKNPTLNTIKDLVDKKINQMLQEAKQMENHQYVLKQPENSLEKAIGYPELDGNCFNKVKGYKTGFAYIQEWQRKKITTNLLIKKLSLLFSLGCFSYAKILEQYHLILGVTGTLSGLTDFQTKQMKHHGIHKFTYTPSVFGESKFKFDEINDTFLMNSQEQYFEKIKELIDHSKQNKRSIIVFFENDEVLNKFYKHHIENRNYQVQILNQSSDDKNLIIMKAAYSQVVTLSTKLFGRGTDFKCFDQIVIDNSGIHCIQTFLSDTLTEQVQIQGRVARNGEPGSYSLVVSAQDIMQKFNIQENEISNISQDKLYKKLEQIRKRKMDINDEILKQNLQEADKFHKISMRIKELLENGSQNIEEINKLIAELSPFADLKELKVVSHSEEKPSNMKQPNMSEQNEMKIKPTNKFKMQGTKAQFENISLLIGCFTNSPDNEQLPNDLMNNLKVSLDVIGVKNFNIVKNEIDFINQIENYDQVWVISNHAFINKGKAIEESFVSCIEKHLKQKKGLLILNDNEPFFYHANKIFQKIPVGYEEQNPIYMRFEGNDRALNQLTKGEYNKELQFCEHPLTLGLEILFEGETICYPKIINDKIRDTYDDYYDIDIIGTSKTLKPCIFALNGNRKRGRIAFDCGFTKLLAYNWKSTQGTEIYFQNCYQWLCNLDKEEK